MNKRVRRKTGPESVDITELLRWFFGAYPKESYSQQQWAEIIGCGLTDSTVGGWYRAFKGGKRVPTTKKGVGERLRALQAARTTHTLGPAAHKDAGGIIAQIRALLDELERIGPGHTAGAVGPTDTGEGSRLR